MRLPTNRCPGGVNYPYAKSWWYCQISAIQNRRQGTLWDSPNTAWHPGHACCTTVHQAWEPPEPHSAGHASQAAWMWCAAQHHAIVSELQSFCCFKNSAVMFPFLISFSTLLFCNLQVFPIQTQALCKALVVAATLSLGCRAFLWLPQTGERQRA